MAKITAVMMRIKKKNKKRIGKKFIIGIDEVGRGSLAGPVVVTAVLSTGNWQLATGKPKGKLRDSKKLSPKRRGAWFKFFENNPYINYAIARVYPRQIEKKNISKAANLAAERAFNRLKKTCRLSLAACSVYLDGGLYLGNGDKQQAFVPSSGRGETRDKRWFAKTVVRGDEKIKAIAISSIIAKVTRDKGMIRLAKKYPRYGFETHKGYGTKAHTAAIKKHGPSEAHRLTFLQKSYRV